MGYPDKFNSWISINYIVTSFGKDKIDIDKIEKNNNRIEFSM